MFRRKTNPVYMKFALNLRSGTELDTDLPTVQLLVSCAAEADNPEVSQDYHLLRRMIDNEELFLEVRDLGEDLAMQIIR